VRYVGRVKNAGRHVAARTFKRKADAEAWAHEQYRALAFGEFIPPARSATAFSDVVAGFVESRRGQVAPHTWRTDSDNLASAVSAWGSRRLSSIGPSEVLAYLTDQLAIKARSTVQRSRTSLSALFAYALRERMLTRNPVIGVRLPPGRHQESEGVETFTDAELTDVLVRQYERNPGMAEVTEFLSLTGLRWSELRALRVADLQTVPFPSIRIVRAQSDARNHPGPANLRHHDAVIGKLRGAGFDVAMVAHAYSILDGYIYGFALTKMSVPFQTPEEMEAMANTMFEPFPANEYRNLAEFVSDHVMKPGYDYADEFEYGLDLILDAIESRATSEQR
jgi:hypothetical protein